MSTWDTDLVTMVRVLIGDGLEPYRYASGYLKQVVVTAGILTTPDVEMMSAYTFDLGDVSISPDPVVAGDAVAQSLLVLRAACVLTTGEFQMSLGQGIRVRDGDSSIDTSVTFGGYNDLLTLGPCKAYEKLRWQIVASPGAAGGAILGPYRGPYDPAIGQLESLMNYVANVFTTEAGQRGDRRR